MFHLSVFVLSVRAGLNNGAFYDCSGLESVTIGSGVNSIGERAFENCRKLVRVYIHDLSAWCKIDFGDYGSNPLGYAHHLYVENEELKELTFPNGTTEVKPYVFYGCSELTSITIPNSATSIGACAFENCSGLSSITIPDSATSIGNRAFKNCSGLLSITISDSVTSIEDQAFYWCSGLKSVTIPDSVTSIGNQALEGCSGLTSVSIGSSLTSIGSYVFSSCSSLESIEVSQGNPVYHSAGNCLIETDSKTLIAGCKTSIIPNDGSVISIGTSAFSGCSEMRSIEIPDNLTSIGERAFDGCSRLTSIIIPSGVTTIGDQTFCNCKALKSIEIPDSVTSIGENSFFNCGELIDIQFNGTVNEWNSIQKGLNWDTFAGNYTITCTDGTIDKNGKVTYFE